MTEAGSGVDRMKTSVLPERKRNEMKRNKTLMFLVGGMGQCSWKKEIHTLTHNNVIQKAKLVPSCVLVWSLRDFLFRMEKKEEFYVFNLFCAIKIIMILR